MDCASSCPGTQSPFWRRASQSSSSASATASSFRWTTTTFNRKTLINKGKEMVTAIMEVGQQRSQSFRVPTADGGVERNQRQQQPQESYRRRSARDFGVATRARALGLLHREEQQQQTRASPNESSSRRLKLTMFGAPLRAVHKLRMSFNNRNNSSNNINETIPGKDRSIETGRRCFQRQDSDITVNPWAAAPSKATKRLLLGISPRMSSVWRASRDESVAEGTPATPHSLTHDASDCSSTGSARSGTETLEDTSESTCERANLVKPNNSSRVSFDLSPELMGPCRGPSYVIDEHIKSMLWYNRDDFKAHREADQKLVKGTDKSIQNYISATNRLVQEGNLDAKVSSGDKKNEESIQTAGNSAKERRLINALVPGLNEGYRGLEAWSAKMGPARRERTKKVVEAVVLFSKLLKDEEKLVVFSSNMTTSSRDLARRLGEADALATQDVSRLVHL